MNTVKVDGIEIPVEKLEALGFRRGVEVWPCNNDNYFYVDNQGFISNAPFSDGFLFNESQLAIGNCFKTEQGAIDYRERLYATQRVLKRLRELEGDWVADWTVKRSLGGTKKFLVSFIHESGRIIMEGWHAWQRAPAEWYSTKKAWEWVITNMESDVKLMMGVKK